MNGRHVADSGRIHEYPALEERFDEDPARFLESNELMATARIAGIRNADLLDAYETVAEEITTGNYQTVILEAIAERKAELGLDVEMTADPTPETTTDPVAATDGGTVTEPVDQNDADELHPDVKGLEAGDVLFLEREESTEYIFPSTPACDQPYLLRAFDGEGDERTAEPMGMSFDEVLSRLDGSPDPVPQAEIEYDAPRNAARSSSETPRTGGDA